MKFPAACPEIPAADVVKATAYYRDQLGFTLDWISEDADLAQVSRGDSRLFVTSPSFREGWGDFGKVLLWINLDSRQEVDDLHAQWKASGAIIAMEPTSQPYKLREFFAEDLDGNVLRIFYDFAWEERALSERAES